MGHYFVHKRLVPLLVPVDEVRMAEELSHESIVVRVMHQALEITTQPLSDFCKVATHQVRFSEQKRRIAWEVGCA